jgi:hypothetical protein
MLLASQSSQLINQENHLLLPRVLLLLILQSWHRISCSEHLTFTLQNVAFFDKRATISEI